MESSIPQSYLLNRNSPPEQVEKVLAALSITPIYFVVISDMKDVPLSAKFEVEVLKADTEDKAIEVAQFTFVQQGMPSLVIGSSAGLTAIFADGKRESINVG